MRSGESDLDHGFDRDAMQLHSGLATVLVLATPLDANWVHQQRGTIEGDGQVGGDRKLSTFNTLWRV